MHQNIEIALIKTQSRAFRTSHWTEGSPSNRTMTLSTQQEWLIDNSVNVLEWPSHSLGLNASNISGETWKCASAPIQPDRAWEVKRWGEEWQIIVKFWCAKLVVSYPKRLEAVKVLQLSTELRVWRLMQCTYFSFFICNYFTKLWQFCFCFVIMVYGVQINVEKK